MKLKVADIVVREREIEVPKACPHCKKALKAEDLILKYFASTFLRSKPKDQDEVTGDADDPKMEIFEIDFDIPCTYVACHHCGEHIHEPREKHIVEPTEEERDPGAWSLALDELIFAPKPV